MDQEKIINRISMISLMIAGAIFIYEGVKYINMKQENPSLSEKVYVAGAFALILGVLEIGFGVWHFFIK